jgi:PAS domain S-box-containing protein
VNSEFEAESQALQRIAGIAQLSTASEAAMLVVFDKFSVGAGLHDELLPHELELVLTLCAQPVAKGEQMRYPNLRKSIGGGDAVWAREHPHLASVVGAPIWVSGVRIGTLVVTSTEPHALDDYELNMLADLSLLAADQLESTRALESAQQKEFRAAQIFQEISDGVITVNEFGHIKRLNRAAEKIFGVTTAQVKGQRIAIDHGFGLTLGTGNGSDKVPSLPNIASLVGDRKTIAGRDSENRALVLELTVAEVALKEERTFVLTVRDNTELHDAQLMLRQHSFIVEHTEGAVMVTDADNRIEWCNPGFEAMTGYTLEQIRGKNTTELLFCDDTPAETLAEVKQSMRDKQSLSLEMIWLRKTGQPFWISLEAHPVCDVNGSLIRYVSLGFDITERKRSAQMKSDFVSMVSHELRTPLTVITGTIEALRDGIAGPMPELADELLTMGGRNCASLETLIDDLLDVNQLEAGVVTLNSRQIVIKSLLLEVQQSMESIAEDAQVKLSIDSACDSLRVFSDPDRLNQVMTNLIGNAIKFSPRDSTVTISCETRDDQARIVVTDQGGGISHEFEPKLFEMFTRDPAVEASGKEGFGLGLCISKGLMDRMGGQIGFETPENGGASFWVELPLLGAQAPVSALSDPELV